MRGGPPEPKKKYFIRWIDQTLIDSIFTNITEHIENIFVTCFVFVRTSLALQHLTILSQIVNFMTKYDDLNYYVFQMMLIIKNTNVDENTLLECVDVMDSSIVKKTIMQILVNLQWQRILYSSELLCNIKNTIQNLKEMITAKVENKTVEAYNIMRNIIKDMHENKLHIEYKQC